MESKDLLHPETDENQIIEVNSGSSTEDQINAELNEMPSTENAVNEEKIAQNEPASEMLTETSAAEETVPEAETPAAEEIVPEADAPASEETVPEAEVPQTKAPEESQTVMEMMSEIESNANSQEQEEDEEKEDEENTENVEQEYANFSPEMAIEELSRVVENPDYNQIKLRVGILKAKLLDYIKSNRKVLLDAFIAEGGAKEDFETEPSELEIKFNNALQKFRDNKAKFLESIEAEKQRNLEAKLAIIDSLKVLVESEANLKELNDKFKELQEKWKEIGPVPQNESTNLWQNYHFYVEKFFDILRINKELRSLDLKKNLELKIKLCETAESLLLQDSISKSFKSLQQLHDEWKEIGPVPEDKKEEIWDRFKNASDQINQRRREYYDKIYGEQQNNYNAKVVLCEQAEEIVSNVGTSAKENNEVADKLTSLLKVWKTLGQAPPKLNDEIWNRFKSTLDKFFETKKEFFQQVKDLQMQNYNLKLNLAIQAEAIAARTDWRQATEEILKLQQEWKNIGATPRKLSEQIWKRFRGACDKFFAAKSHYFSNIQEIEAENLRLKEDLIQKILSHEFGEDKNANMDAMKTYQREWTEIGHVPKKDKDRVFNEYRDAVNRRFSDLKMSVEDVRRDTFKSRIDTILNDPNADRLLDKEKRFLTNKLSQLKDDINLWENNLGFFANSKNADLLKEEFSKKIDAAKAEVKELEYKIRMMNSPKKDKGANKKKDE